MYFLFESSLGLALFKANEWDKVSTKTQKLQQDVVNYQSCKKIVSMEAVSLFHGHGVACDILSQLKKGELPKEVKAFVKANFPGNKKSPDHLAVQEKTLATLLNENLKIKTICGETYNEIFRGIRLHLPKFMSSPDGNFNRRNK